MPVETSLMHVGDRGVDRVDFLVRTDQPLYQNRLLKMGRTATAAPDEFSRRLDAVGDVDDIFDPFSRNIEEMILQSARLVPIDWERGLSEFADRSQGSGLHWWLYGSGAIAVRGLPIVPGDLDFHVDDGYLAGRLMTDLLVEPTTRMRGWVADLFGRAFAGVLVEWLADAHPTGLDPPHEQEEAASSHLDVVPWNGREIAVPSLDVQLVVAERRGTEDRVALIRDALRR